MQQDEQIASSSCYCINLRRASNAVTDYYDRILSCAGIKLNQYALLCNIQKIAPCSVAELSRKVRLDRTTLVRNLKALYAAGWIYDEANPGSRRSQISLTETGIRKVLTAKACWQQAQESIENTLGDEALKKMTEALLALEKMNLRDGNQKL